MPTTYVTCPKCLGAKTFSAFSHIVAGRCFTCAGNGTIEASRAGVVAPFAPVTACRNITLPGFGPVSIDRHGDDLRVMWDHGMATFSVVAGKVVIDTLSDSPRRRGEHGPLTLALQGALRG